MMKFSQKNEKDGTTREIGFDDDCMCIPDVLEHFEDFLYACGYRLKGSIEVVEDFLPSDEDL